MQLTRLEIRDLYGSVNLDIRFNPELNLLVGINGSGKTSALNVIDWLLRPNLLQLALTHFKPVYYTQVLSSSHPY